MAHPLNENFKQQIVLKGKSSHKKVRKLADVLTQQYQGLNTSESVKNNLTALRDAKTFTVITGHQLNIFTGTLLHL